MPRQQPLRRRHADRGDTHAVLGSHRLQVFQLGARVPSVAQHRREDRLAHLVLGLQNSEVVGPGVGCSGGGASFGMSVAVMVVILGLQNGNAGLPRRPDMSAQVGKQAPGVPDPGPAVPGRLAGRSRPTLPSPRRTLPPPSVQCSVIGSGNSAQFDLAIPNSLIFVGLRLYQQAFVLDPAANRVGAVMSEAAEALVGH